VDGAIQIEDQVTRLGREHALAQGLEGHRRAVVHEHVDDVRTRGMGPERHHERSDPGEL
jgi:hypothetical protein